MKSAEKEVTSFGKSISKMGIASTIGFAAAGVAITSFLKDATRASIAFEQRFTSFSRLVEGDANRFLNSLSAAADGTVSQLSLVTQANNAILLGIKQQQLPELLEASRLLGAAVGRTTEEAFADLTIGIGRQSRMILDNLGIIVKAEDAYKSYAKSIGISVDALTAQQRTIAFNQAVMTGIEESTTKLEGSLTDATTATQKFDAAWKDFSKDAGTIYIPILTKLAEIGSKEIKEASENLRALRGEMEFEGLGLKFTSTGFKLDPRFKEREGAEMQEIDPFFKAQELAEAENKRMQEAINNIEIIKQREAELNSFIANADLTQLENVKELIAKKQELSNLEKESIDVLGASFKDMVKDIKEEMIIEEYHGEQVSSYEEFRRKAGGGGGGSGYFDLVEVDVETGEPSTTGNTRMERRFFTE